MDYYPLLEENLTGKIGDYWLEEGEVKYNCGELKDIAPSGSLYTNYEWVVTVKVLVDPSEPLFRRLMAREKKGGVAVKQNCSREVIPAITASFLSLKTIH